MNLGDDKKGAGVKFPPPLVFVLFILTAYGLNHIWLIAVDNHIDSIKTLQVIAIVIMALGFIICIIAFLAFKRAKTHIEPWQPTSSIILSGIFAYSRNPIYVAFCIITIGVGIFTNNLWIIISFIPAIITVYFIAVKKEEIYLESKFGEEYILYKDRVRRWL